MKVIKLENPCQFCGKKYSNIHVCNIVIQNRTFGCPCEECYKEIVKLAKEIYGSNMRQVSEQNNSKE